MGKLATPCSVFCIVSEEFEGHWSAWLIRKKFVRRSIVCHLVTHCSVELWYMHARHCQFLMSFSEQDVNRTFLVDVSPVWWQSCLANTFILSEQQMFCLASSADQNDCVGLHKSLVWTGIFFSQGSLILKLLLDSQLCAQDFGVYPNQFMVMVLWDQFILEEKSQGSCNTWNQLLFPAGLARRFEKRILLVWWLWVLIQILKFWTLKLCRPYSIWGHEYGELHNHLQIK